MYEEERKCVQHLVVKPAVKRQPGRTRHRRDDIIKVDLKAV